MVFVGQCYWPVTIVALMVDRDTAFSVAEMNGKLESIGKLKYQCLTFSFIMLVIFQYRPFTLKNSHIISVS